MSTPELKELDCVLTPEEILQKHERLVQCLGDLDSKRAEAKESAASYSKELKAIEKDIGELAAAARTGRERRQVPCLERRNLVAMRMETVRLDTREVFSTRAFSKDELEDVRQLVLPQVGEDPEGESITEDQRTETGTLPRHPVVDTLRGPAERLPCPGPRMAEGSPQVPCPGDRCNRCAGMQFIPAEAAPELPEGLGVTAEPANDDSHGDVTIDDPAAVLAAAAQAPADDERH